MLREVGRPLTIEDVELAEPGPFEVVVRVAAAGLCHSDLRFMEGSYQPTLPAVMGHESAGVVEETGPAVAHVAPGDHVITFLTVFCGTCTFCLTGKPQLCDNREATQRDPGEVPRLSANGEELHQFLNLASFAERMLVHENAVVRITPEIPLDRAALLGCGAATGLGAVFNTARVAPGDAVAVIGCGGVGLSAVQGARIAGAGPIIAVDTVAEKLELAMRVGATHTVSGSEDVGVRVREVTDGLGVDHAIEAVGTTATAELAFELLKPGGTATVVGLIPLGEKVRIPGDALLYEKALQGSSMGSNRFRIDVPRYVKMYQDGRLNLDDMITARLDLTEINDGFAMMDGGRAARTIIAFDGVG